MEDIKELLDLLIAQTEDLRKNCPNIPEYIEGRIDGFKLVRDYVERKISNNN